MSIRIARAAGAGAFLWLVFVGPAAADTVSTLFVDHEPLAITISLDPKALCREKGKPGCNNLPTTLAYKDHAGVDVTLEVELRARGGWRLKETNCTIPPLFIIFAENVDETGLFAGQRFLPLTTHCQPRPSRYEQYVVKEYLAYRLYELFSEASLRTRLLRVTYENPRTGKSVARYAFLTEHFDWLAARYDAEVSRPKQFDPARADPMEMATLDLFQYMIGNTDWSVVIPHNVIFLNKPDGSVTAIPYDFDFAGLVDTVYAAPPEQLPIDTVRRRYYRGFCLPGIDWEALFATFNARRDAVHSLVDTLPGLSKYSRKRTKVYMTRFFSVLESDRSRQSRIIDACRDLPVSVPSKSD